MVDICSGLIAEMSMVAHLLRQGGLGAREGRLLEAQGVLGGRFWGAQVALGASAGLQPSGLHWETDSAANRRSPFHAPSAGQSVPMQTT